MTQERGELTKRLFTRRQILKGAALVSGVVVVGCSPAAPASTPAPTKAAATTAEPARPQATTAATAAPAATQAPAMTQIKQLVLAVEGEPETGLLPNNACSLLTNFPVYNIYEYLTTRQPDGKVVGQMAESFGAVDPKTWRFKLRKGITFTNGEPFNADAVLAAVEDEMDPKATGRCKNEYPTLASPAKKVDDYTVDLMTTVPDPLLPVKIIRFKIPAPNWRKTTPVDTLNSTAVGTGPYVLAEWNKGSYLMLKINEKYWGAKKPTIQEVKIVGRKEASVRAAMVQTGEAHIAYTIPAELMKQVPKTIVEKTTECVGFRLNTFHPVLKDARVRQAITYAVDAQGLMDALYPGYSTPLNGHMVRPSCAGFNPSLKPYPHDVAAAKKLVQDAGAAGTSLELYTRTGNWAKIDELAEAICGAITETGLKAKPKMMEAGQWRESLFAVKPDQPHSDMLLTSASNATFDTFRVMSSYYPCDGQFSLACDKDFTDKMNQVSTLAGDARSKGFQDLWAYVYDKYWMVPLFGLDFIHGVAASVKWTPREDGFTYFSEIELG